MFGSVFTLIHENSSTVLFVHWGDFYDSALFLMITLRYNFIINDKFKVFNEIIKVIRSGELVLMAFVFILSVPIKIN